jgi:hypothetical protein
MLLWPLFLVFGKKYKLNRIFKFVEDKDEIVKVNCSYCGKEIECPMNMLDKVEKHACFNCFQNLPKSESKAKVHVDMPMNEAIENIADEFANKQAKEVFPDIWTKHKDEMKEMSKKELAEKMFGEGVYLGFIGALACPEAMSETKAAAEEEK